MTRSAILQRLTTAGVPDDDAARRADLLDRVSARFVSLVGAAPTWRWFVPGRIEVFGKHTDYAGGRSLLAAAPRGFAVVGRARTDGVVRVLDARDQHVVQVALEGATLPGGGWGKYVAVTARRLARNFPGAALGMDIAFGSALPRAAGMSSSSALVVGIATALIARGQLEDRPEWHGAIASPSDLAWYLGCVENGLDFAGLPGTDGVGTHGGSEDHTAILTCRGGHLSQYGFIPVRHLGDVAWPRDWRFILVSSGVHADKAGSVRDRYNHASLTTRALLEMWNRDAAMPAPSLGAALATAPDATERLHALVQRRPHGTYDATVLQRRLAHFVAEDGRVPQAAAAVAAGDAAAFAALAAASQADADGLLGNQVPETRDLAACARDCGILAASSFGAGFGGSVWGLALARDAGAAAQAWVAAYRSRYPRAGAVEMFVATPGPGLIALH